MIKLKDILLEAPARVNGKWGYTAGLKSPHRLPKERHFKLDDIDETDDYHGEHTAPDKDGAPLNDVTANGVYPDDIYSDKGARYYGDGTNLDSQSISIIQQCKGKPNTIITIYRAVPKQNADLQKTQKNLAYLLSYFASHHYFPVKDPILDPLLDKYRKSTLSYDQQQQHILDDLQAQYDDIETKLKAAKKITINSGDWVTINKQYAVEHGKAALNNSYTILSKKVKCSTIYTDGNSIHEWGYNP